MPVVYNAAISDRCLIVGDREVYFDGWGFCDAVTGAEAELLLTIPGFAAPSPAQLAERQALKVFVEGSAVGTADERAEGLLEAAKAEALAPEEATHEPWKLTPEQAGARWNELELAERVQQATEGEFSRKQLLALFELENRGKKSKKVLAAIDQALVRVTPARGAAAINRALLKANTPVLAER